MTDEQFLKDMGKKIREIRRSKSISLNKMVELSGIYKSSLSELENGKRNSYSLTLKTIADILEVEVSDFFI